MVRLVTEYIKKTIGISTFVIASEIIGLLLPFAIIIVGYSIEILGQSTTAYLYHLGTLGKVMLAIGSFIKGVVFSNIFLAPLKALFLGASIMFLFILANFVFAEKNTNSKLLEKMFEEYILAKLRQNEELAKNLSKRIAHIQIKIMRYLS